MMEGSPNQGTAMKKKTGAASPTGARCRNFVAKHAFTFNKPKVFKNKKKDYQRHPKHKSWGVSFWDFGAGGLFV